MQQRNYEGAFRVYNINWLRDLAKLISTLSLRSESDTWKNENPEYYEAIKNQFSELEYPYHFPAEEDFCRALNTLECWGLYLTASKSKMTEAQKKEMAEVIYRELPSESLWIKDAFGYLADMMHKAGYTFSKKEN